MGWLQLWVGLLLLWSSTLLATVHAAKDSVIGTRSLKPCMPNSGITATLVDVSFHTNTSTLHFDINAYSTISGNVRVLMTVYAYGFKAFSQEIDPCSRRDWTQLCPMSPQPIQITSNQDLGSDLVSQVPAAAFKVPDLDAYIRIQIVSADGNNDLLACVDAELSNGVTVEKGVVSWTTAFVVGGLVLWAIFVISLTNPAAHYYHFTTAKFAAYAFALYTFVQSLGLIGCTSVPLPPIVSAWTQNCVWAVGIVELDFLQKFFGWYIRSTGGHLSSLFNQISTTSVLVMKRDLSTIKRTFQVAGGIGRRSLSRRASDGTESPNASTQYNHIMVKGIERVAFKAGIEQSNLFITSYSMYIIFAFVVVFLYLIFTAAVVHTARRRILGMEKRFPIFRQHWNLMLKKVVFCLVIMGFPALIALSLWEMTMRDSPAVVLLAVVIFLAVSSLMGVAVFRLYSLLRKTAVMPFSIKGPLARFSLKAVDTEKPPSTGWRDSTETLTALKATASRELKYFSILTVPYRRSGAYWVLPLMLFIFTKSALVGLSQQHLYNAPSEESSSVGTVKGTAQAIGFLIIDLLWLIGVSWVRPWMDKPTNVMGIASASMGLLNGIFLLIFTEIIPRQAKPAKPIVGVLFVLFNVIMSLVFLGVTIVSGVYAIIDWKKGHPNAPPMEPIGCPGASSILPEEYGNHNMTSTPDPFLPPNHENEVLPSGPFTHTFDADGRASASTFDSRNIGALQPTEPNMSITSFDPNGQGAGVFVTPASGMSNFPGYPLQNVSTSHSAQSPQGVVMISSGKSEDGRSHTGSVRSARSRDGQQPLSNIPTQGRFGRQDSHLSLKSVSSTQPYNIPSPTPSAHIEEEPSIAGMVMENAPPIPQNREPGVAY